MRTKEQAVFDRPPGRWGIDKSADVITRNAIYRQGGFVPIGTINEQIRRGYTEATGAVRDFPWGRGQAAAAAKALKTDRARYEVASAWNATLGIAIPIRPNTPSFGDPAKLKALGFPQWVPRLKGGQFKDDRWRFRVESIADRPKVYLPTELAATVSDICGKPANLAVNQLARRIDEVASMFGGPARFRAWLWRGRP